MKPISALVFMLVLLSAIGQAQQVYDRFDGKWLDIGKWQPDNSTCYNTLECIREIQNGKLRMAARNFGATDSDSGVLWGGPILWFRNPSAITTIKAGITVRSFSGTACLTNDTTPNGQAQIGGTFFNAGTGDGADDVFAILYTYVDTANPTTIKVNGWWGWKDLGDNQKFAEYPIGTPLTATFKWDKAHHRFIARVKIKGERGNGLEVFMPYPMSDTTPPAYPDRRLVTVALSPNCTTGQTSAQTEATFDNVTINP
jgi:hypothetical protein